MTKFDNIAPWQYLCLEFTTAVSICVRNLVQFVFLYYYHVTTLLKWIGWFFVFQCKAVLVLCQISLLPSQYFEHIG